MVSKYNRSAPWYYAADGSYQQAVNNGNGWEYPLAPAGEDGREVRTVNDPSLVAQLNKQALGFDPDDKQVNADKSVSIMNPKTGKYEQAVLAGESGIAMPLSMAREQNLPIHQVAFDPKDQTTFERLMEFTEGPRFLASVAGGAGAGAIGGGISAFQAGGMEGLVKYGTDAVNGAVNKITSIPDKLSGGFDSAKNFISGITDGTEASNVLTDSVTNMDGFKTDGIDWGTGLDNNGIDTSFLNDPAYGAQNFGADPILGADGPDWGTPSSGTMPPAGTIPAGRGALGSVTDFLTENPWVTTAAGIAGNIGAAAFGANAASDAADAQVGATRESIAEARRQYDTTRADNAPFLATGTAANARLRQLLGLDAGYTAPDSGSLVRKFTTADRDADPVYQSGLQFGLDEGTKGINQRALATGSYDSGNTLKALTRYGNDYGSTKAGDAYNRYTNDQSNIYARLTGTSGSGQTAVNTNAQAGQAATNSVTNSIDAAGNARAAGIVGGANAWGNAATGIGTALNNYNQSEILKKLLSGRT